MNLKILYSCMKNRFEQHFRMKTYLINVGFTILDSNSENFKSVSEQYKRHKGKKFSRLCYVSFLNKKRNVKKVTDQTSKLNYTFICRLNLITRIHFLVNYSRDFQAD